MGSKHASCSAPEAPQQAAPPLSVMLPPLPALRPLPPLPEPLASTSRGHRAAVVVLGHALRADGSAPRALAERVATAARLHFASNGTLPIVATGGEAVAGLTEAQAIGRLLHGPTFKVPRRSVHVEHAARNTIENALHSIPLLRRLRIRRVALVTNDWHMPRAAYVFRAVFTAHMPEGGPELQVVPVAAPSGHSHSTEWRAPRPWQCGLDVEQWTRAERAEYDRGLLLHHTPRWLAQYGVPLLEPEDEVLSATAKELEPFLVRPPDPDPESEGTGYDSARAAAGQAGTSEEADAE